MKDSTKLSEGKEKNEVKFAPVPNGLSLHSKTYYTSPGAGGDEHYVFIPYFEGKKGTLDYSGPFTVIESEVYNEFSPAGGYLNVVLKLSPYPGSGLGQDAVLKLSTSYPYWFTFPKGHGSTNWQAVLSNSQYAVNRVTN